MSALPKVILSAAKRYATPTWKAIVGQIDRIQAGTGRRMGTWDQLLKETGIYKLSQQQRLSVRSAMEGKTVADDAVNQVVEKIRSNMDVVFSDWIKRGGKVKEVHWEFNEAGQMVRKTIVRPPRYVENYFPRYWKPNISEFIFHDANSIMNEAKKITPELTKQLTGEAKLDAASRILLEEIVAKRMAINKGMHKYTAEAITHLTATNPGMTPGQAMRVLHNSASSQIFNPAGPLERARVLANVPAHFLEADAVNVLRRYGHGWARRAAESDEWGVDYSGFINLWKQTSGQEAKDMEKLASFITGRGEFGISKGFKKFTTLFTEFEVATKIGLGTAVIPNLTQLTISVIPKAGVMRTVRGFAKYFTPEGRKVVTQSGVLSRGYTAMQALTGGWREVLHLKNLNMEGLSWYEQLSRGFVTATTTPFNYVNRMLNAVSASTAEVYIKDLLKAARKGGAWRRAWATDQLRALNISSADRLTTNKLLEGMYRFTFDAQLQRNVLRDPMWMNDPRFRFLALFKRFGYRQFQYVYDRLLKDEWRHGNFLPALKLVAGGVAGGQFVWWAKDAIAREIFKAPELWDEKDQSMFSKAVWGIVQSGSFGVMSDIARLRGDDYASAVDSAVRNGFFAITPLAATEIMGLPGSYTRMGWPEFARRFAVDWVKEGFPEAVEGGVRPMLIQVSPMGSYLAAAIKKRQQQKQALVRALKKR